MCGIFVLFELLYSGVSHMDKRLRVDIVDPPGSRLLEYIRCLPLTVAPKHAHVPTVSWSFLFHRMFEHIGKSMLIIINESKRLLIPAESA